MKLLNKIAFLLITAAFIIPVFTGSSTIYPEEWKVPAWADTISNPVDLSQANINAGKKIFNTHCWSCHGMSGKGNGPASEMLSPKPADLASAEVQKQSDGVLFWKITYGRGVMVSYGQSISQKQRWQLVCYLRQLNSDSQKSSN